MSGKYVRVASPVGELLLVGDGRVIEQLLFDGDERFDDSFEHAPDAFVDARTQLAEYFAGERDSFELELTPRGTEFQRSVWRALEQIPYGETRSYGEIAAAVGRPKAARAVGMANNRNPIAVIVPCHRVIGSGGAMVGYAGGLGRKTWLLEHERGARG